MPNKLRKRKRRMTAKQEMALKKAQAASAAKRRLKKHGLEPGSKAAIDFAWERIQERMNRKK
jgi:hypothetical protein